MSPLAHCLRAVLLLLRRLSSSQRFDMRLLKEHQLRSLLHLPPAAPASVSATGAGAGAASSSLSSAGAAAAASPETDEV
jgi:hypothetical protein